MRNATVRVNGVSVKCTVGEPKIISSRMNEIAKDILKSKEKSFAFLRDAGIITKGGNLSRNYK